jgi:SAM-dependent methyltransferase
MDTLNSGENSFYNRRQDIPRRFDYFIVGSHVALASPHFYEQKTGFPFCLGVYDSDIHVTRRDLLCQAIAFQESILAKLDTALFERTLPLPHVLEVIEIFTRVCIRRNEKENAFPFHWQLYEASPQLKTQLQARGFTQDPQGLFTKIVTRQSLFPRSQVNSMEEVYQRPLDIPWNFGPLDYDVYMPLLETKRGGRVLDIGAGFGRNALPLEKHGYEVYGIDISPTAVQRCRQFVRKPQNFTVGEVTALPFQAHFFDFVIDVGCLHFLQTEQLSTALLEIKRVLKTGGILYSRIFKPRPQEWLDRQPYIATQFGLHSDEALALFAAHFRTRQWREEHPDMTYITALKEEK